MLQDESLLLKLQVHFGISPILQMCIDKFLINHSETFGRKRCLYECGKCKHLQIPQRFCVETCAMKYSLYSFFFFSLDESQFGLELLWKDTRGLHTCFPAANGKDMTRSAYLIQSPDQYLSAWLARKKHSHIYLHERDWTTVKVVNFSWIWSLGAWSCLIIIYVDRIC